MKKILIVLFLVCLAASPLVAVDFSVFEQAFQTFADGAADALPFNSTVGLNWSDAYIGQFPHFGIGLSVGATTIPYDAVNEAAKLLNIGITDLATDIGIPQLATIGVPLPAYSVDARLGGLLLPFDVGVKAGYLPDEAKFLLPAGLNVDYLLLGADVRLALMKEKGMLPAISIGGGYNYMKGSVSATGLVSGAQTVADVAGHTISVSDPALTFNWQANVIDLKAQASKKLLLFTFYGGAGASLGISQAGGGLEADVLFDGVPITQEDIDLVKTYYDGIGETPPDLSAAGILVGAKANGWGFRAFGGVSIDLFILKVDVSGMYNFTSKSLGANVNARIQL